MSTPRVTEITRQLESVGHDTFIDDLAVAGAARRLLQPPIRRWSAEGSTH